MTRAFIVADLGFGDSGKGTITDALVRREHARLVVRWNGGAQAGHTVVTDDGRTHTFSQLGAGTFVPGVRTHLAEDVVVHPTGLVVEARHLVEKGVPDALARLTIAESARITTPYHQAAGRLRELARGAGAHGTCGVGVGETIRDAIEAGEDVIRMRDLRKKRIRRVLPIARERLRASVEPVDGEAAEAELAILDDEEVGDRWLEAARALIPNVVPDEQLDVMLAEGTTVLEGAQGILLDERFGLHPHTTWSDCTPSAAVKLLSRHGFDGEIRRIGVTRTYTTRHGAGPFPSEDRTLVLPEPHNPSDGWQGRFRVGALDLVLLRYAARVAGPLDQLAVTHCDHAAGRVLAVAYDGARDTTFFVHDADGLAVDLRHGDLAHQERLGRALANVRPILVASTAKTLPDRIAAAIGVPLRITSHGPRASDKIFV